MPCYDPPDTPEDANRRGYVHKDQLAAVLCGLLTAYGVDILDRVDWRKTGVPKFMIQQWWLDHQQRDAARKDD